MTLRTRIRRISTYIQLHICALVAQNINKHYGLVLQLEIGKKRYVRTWHRLDTENCVCMQHNEANTIIYKTPVGDMDFHSLSIGASKSIFKTLSVRNAALQTFLFYGPSRTLNEFAIATKSPASELSFFRFALVSSWAKKRFSGEFLMD